AQEILMISKQFFMPGDVMSHVIINFAESFYCYYYTDKKQGKMQLQETLKFLKKIGAEDFRKTLKLQYDKRILRENRSEK
ncbi:Rgg/GadR/MutR family transcriptional regulator, partial [Lactococcus lactis]